MLVASRAWGAMLIAFAAAAGCSLFTGPDGASDPDDDDAGRPLRVEAGAGDAASTGNEGGALDGGADASTYAFTDDFNRPDTTSGIGNGWNEKSVGFRLSGGEAERLSVDGGDYRQVIASRPASETVGDVEASVEFRFKVDGGGYVQVHARVQTATLGTPSGLDSYFFFRNLKFADDQTFTIARQHGTSTFVTLKDLHTASPINTSDRYRIRLRVTGESPVVLAAFVERQSGASWVIIGSDTFSDTSPDRIGDAGVVGLSAGNDPTGTFAYDNFSAQGL